MPCRRMPGSCGCFCRRGGIHGGDHGSVSAGNGAGVLLISAHRVEIAAAASLATVILTGDPFCEGQKTGKESRRHPSGESARGQILDAGSVRVCRIPGGDMSDDDDAGGFYDSLYQQTSAETYSSPFVIQIICLGFVIPLAEEFMFRGVLYKRYRSGRTSGIRRSVHRSCFSPCMSV